MKKKGKDDKKNKGGRPAKYKGEETCQLVYRLSLLNLTDKEIADILEIAESTFNKWKIDFPEFSESLKKGKYIADSKVSEKLFGRAMGYDYTEEKAVIENFRAKIVTLRKHAPPDIGAIALWLKNRHPNKWRDKPEVEGAAVEVNVKFDV